MRKQSYREKQELEKMAQSAAGFISDRYAGISSIEFKMTYYHRSLNPVLMERTLMFSPENEAGFHMKCMSEGCVNGGFDLGPVVTALVKSGKHSTRGRMPCRGKHTAPRHASLGYQVTVEYAGKTGGKARV